MSDVQNQANSQSALIATVQSVTDSAVDPWSYSLSRYVPAHAKTWSMLQATNPQVVASGGQGAQLFFDVPKLGWVTSMAFTAEVEYAADNAGPGLGTNNVLALPAYGWLNFMSSVVIQSSSRELYRMTRASIIAAISDLDYGQQIAIQKGLQSEADPTWSGSVGKASNAANGRRRMLIPFLFACTQKNDLNIAALFSEPVRIVINMSSNYDFYGQMSTTTIGNTVAAGTNATTTGSAIAMSLVNPSLLMQTAVLPAELTAATLSQNYSAGSLTQLSYNYVEETVPTLKALSAAGVEGQTYSHTLTSTNCIHDIYVFCELPPSSIPPSTYEGTDYDGRTAVCNFNTPIPLESVTFSVTGQDVVAEIPAEYLGLFGRPTQSTGFFQACGQGGFQKFPSATAYSVQTADSLNVLNSCYVYRICMSESASKLFSGNMLNLRECSNPVVSVKLGRVSDDNYRPTTNGPFIPKNFESKNVQMRIVLRTAGLISTDSQNGRTVSVLSN